MRFAASLISLLVLGNVAAADSKRAAPTVLAKGADACKELDDAGSPCTTSAKLKSKIGAATVVRVDAAVTRLALAIDTGTERLLSPPFDQWIGDCGAGSCTMLDTTVAKARSIKIAGDPAFALEITSAWSHVNNEGDVHRTSWQTRTFVICGNPGKGWSCQTLSFGDQDTRCSATLSNAGTIKHTCTRTDALAYE